jgi:peptidoglycan/LPS O-acetylase OafA/YrhL
MRNEVVREPLVDAIKAIACLVIVAHHLAFYGPMSDVAYPLIPGLMDGLYQYGRIAVQAFFVMAGFLMAAKFAPSGTSLVTEPLDAIKRRYARLVMPYVAALTLAIVCAALARNWMDHESIPGVPELPQLLTHVFLLQGLLGQESLSAGVWYIAIDFQLFALMMALLWFARKIERRYVGLRATGVVMVAGLSAASLFVFNRIASWDNTAFYFFGSYGLGVLGYWASSRKYGVVWLALLCALLIAALAVDFRSRIAVAGVVMLVLGLARQFDVQANWQAPELITSLGRISYSIFLVHFPLSLVVNAAFFRFFPQLPIVALFGMILSLSVSIGGGALFYRWVESRPLTDRMRLLFPSGLLVSGLLVVLESGYGS